MSGASRFRFSPAMVVALVALLVALGGTALASGPDSSTIDQLRPYGAYTVARGKVTTVDSAGIAGVTRLGRGRFCVKPQASFEKVVGVVSAAPDPAGVALAYVKTGNPDCPAGSLEVITGILARGSLRLKDEGFFVDPAG